MDISKSAKNNPLKVPHPLAGVYYDDPKDLVDPNKMRATVGFIVKDKNDTDLKHFQNIGYEVTDLPKVKTVAVEFPARMANSLAYMVATIKAYPALFQYVEDNKEKYIKMLGNQRSVCLEVYNDHKNAINFYMPM